MRKTKKGGTGSGRRLEGEGSYSATRSYNQGLARALADKSSIERGAKRARRAVEGREGPELRAAEERGRRGPRATKRAPAPRATKRARAN
jgi:hypothetical protein